MKYGILNHIMFKDFGKKIATFLKGEPAITSKGYNDFSTFRSLVNNNQSITKNPYSNNAWVYSAIRTISQNISQVPFLFYENIQNENKLVTSGDLVDLFNNPNPLLTSSRQLIEATMVYFSLRGEAFWILEGRDNITQIPDEIWCVEPNRFTAILDDQNMLTGWKYQGKKVITLDTDHVIHFKYFDPDNEIRGLSPLRAAHKSIEQDMYANEFNSNFFKNGATVGGVLKTSDSLSDDEFNRLKNQFNDRHQGYNKSHNILLIENAVDFTEARMSQKDMDFIELKKLSRSEIFAVYKINEVILGLYSDIKSYEGIKTAHKTYWQECLIPKIRLIESVLYSKLFSKINGGKIVGKFDLSNVEALQEDYHKKVETAKLLFSMGYPVDMINKRLDMGFEDIPGGDVGYLPFGLVEVGSEKSSPELPEDSKQIPHMETKALSSKNTWNTYIKKQKPVQKLFKREIDKFFNKQKGRVLGRLNLIYGKSFNINIKDNNIDVKIKDMTADIFDDDIENKEIKKLFERLYLISLQTGAELVAEEIGVVDFIYMPIPPTELASLKKRFEEFLPDINKTTKDGIRKAIKEGITEGESITEIAKRIQGEYKDIKASRAMTIARTEANATIQAGRQEQMKVEGITQHVWITAGNENVRANHQRLEGSVAIIGEHFKYSDGTYSKLKHPGDSGAGASETIGCLCTTAAILDDI